MPKKGYKQSEEHKAKLRKYLVGFNKGEDKRRFGKGSHHTEEACLKISISQKGILKIGRPRGSRMKQEYKTTEAQRIRECTYYREWRIKVYERDNYTCRDCGLKSHDLNAHHLKEFYLYPELRFSLDNGITLCVPCHQKRHHYKLYKNGLSRLSPASMQNQPA